jgi:hypothetical protein
MSESVLKNIEKELPKLQAELAKMKEAVPKSQALNEVIEYICNAQVCTLLAPGPFDTCIL